MSRHVKKSSMRRSFASQNRRSQIRTRFSLVRRNRAIRQPGQNSTRASGSQIPRHRQVASSDEQRRFAGNLSQRAGDELRSAHRLYVGQLERSVRKPDEPALRRHRRDFGQRLRHHENYRTRARRRRGKRWPTESGRPVSGRRPGPRRRHGRCGRYEQQRHREAHPRQGRHFGAAESEPGGRGRIESHRYHTRQHRIER